MDTQKRALKRRNLIYYLRVFDRNSGDLIGHIVDLTREGLMLISETKLEMNKTYNLKMLWRMEDGSIDEIEFDAESVWSNNDINPDFFDTGLKLVSPDVKTQAKIEKVIAELSFPGTE